MGGAAWTLSGLLLSSRTDLLFLDLAKAFGESAEALATELEKHADALRRDGCLELAERLPGARLRREAAASTSSCARARRQRRVQDVEHPV